MASDDPTWLTVPELARRLGRSESTVRHWRRAYHDALDEDVGGHGYHVYSLRQFLVIERMSAERRDPRDIRAALAGAEQPTATSDFERVVIDRLERIERAIERLAERLASRGES